MRRSAWTIGAAVLAALSLGVAACGGSDGGVGSARRHRHRHQRRPTGAKTGGKLTVLWTGDVDHIDCGQTYYQMGNFICNATQKQLYSYKPDDGADDGAGPRRGRSAGLRGRQDRHGQDQAGRQVLAAVRQGQVTSEDVKYAIERGFFTSVATGFTQSYYADLEGAKVGVKPGTKISGITTPDDQTLVLKFKRAGRRRDGRRRPGLRRDRAGAGGVRREVRRQDAVDLRREPARDRPVHDRERRRPARRSATTRASASTWSATRAGTSRSDFKPAYLDEIDNLEGNDDPGVASRRILTGQSMINGDFSPLPENLKDALDEPQGPARAGRRAAAAAGSR